MRTLAKDEHLLSKEVAIGFIYGAFACPLGIHALATDNGADVLVPKPLNISTFGEGQLMQAGAVSASLSLPSSGGDSPGFRRRGDTALAYDLGAQAYVR